MTFENMTALIEASIKGLGFDPQQAKGKAEGQWSIVIKDATVWIDLFNFKDKPEKYYLQVMSPLCRVPDRKNAEFMQDLLEINFNMYGAWMCKKNDWYYVFTLNDAVDLTQLEVDQKIDRVAYYSTDYFNKLSFKFKDCWDVKNTPPNDGAPNSSSV